MQARKTADGTEDLDMCISHRRLVWLGHVGERTERRERERKGMKEGKHYVWNTVLLVFNETSLVNSRNLVVGIKKDVWTQKVQKPSSFIIRGMKNLFYMRGLKELDLGKQNNSWVNVRLLSINKWEAGGWWAIFVKGQGYTRTNEYKLAMNAFIPQIHKKGFKMELKLDEWDYMTWLLIIAGNWIHWSRMSPLVLQHMLIQIAVLCLNQ